MILQLPSCLKVVPLNLAVLGTVLLKHELLGDISRPSHNTKFLLPTLSPLYNVIHWHDCTNLLKLLFFNSK